MLFRKKKEEKIVEAVSAELEQELDKQQKLLSDVLRTELARALAQHHKLLSETITRELEQQRKLLSETMRTEVAQESEKQRKRLRTSVREWLSPGRTVTASASAWFLNARRPDFPLPKTVIDVGVGRGTPQLYQAYPLAHHLLIEPVSEFSEHIEKILAKYNGSWVHAAVSNVEERRMLFVDKKIPQMSSFSKKEYERKQGADFDVRDVDVVRLDRLIAERKLEGPFLIKTDVEGFDLEVLEGAGALLDQTVFIISECRLDDDFVEPTLNKLVKFLYARSYSIADILEVKWEKDDGRLRFANFAFVNDAYKL